MPEQPDGDNGDLEWMIRSRHDASQLLYNVHQVGKRLRIEDPEEHRAVFENLVGAAFSLWRAAFLALEPSRGRRDSLDAAKEVLEELLKHNRIGYEQEKNLFTWFCRFYLKSAEMRVESAAELLHVDLEQCEALQFVHKRVKDQKTASWEKPQDRWDSAYPAADFLVKKLQEIYPIGGGHGSKKVLNSYVPSY